jgi:hypothetical protein
VEAREAKKVISKAHVRRWQNDAAENARQEDDRRHPEMIVVIGLVAVISMVFGFTLGLLF